MINLTLLSFFLAIASSSILPLIPFLCKQEEQKPQGCCKVILPPAAAGGNEVGGNPQTPA